MDITAITFALIVTVFTPQPEGLAKADVFVLDYNLTAEDCMDMLQQRDPDQYGEHSVLACSFNYDF